LLTDFRDAPQAVCAADAAQLAHAGECIAQLNRKYRGPDDETHGGDRFFLFHRPRRWNAREGVWMGHERKRGKLADLNALLRSGTEDAFVPIIGDKSLLDDVRYVITLDTDTQLPRDSARQMIEAMAHPLNR